MPAPRSATSAHGKPPMGERPLTITKEVAECISAPCPKCGAALSKEVCVANHSFRPPQPGDVTICYTCTVFLKFDEKLNRVELTSDQELQLPPAIQRDLCRVRELIVAFKQSKAAKL